MGRLEALSVERLTDLAERLFSTRPTITGIGPVGSLASFDTVNEALVGPPPARRLAV